MRVSVGWNLESYISHFYFYFFWKWIWIWIRIPNADPDPAEPFQCGSGTLKGSKGSKKSPFSIVSLKISHLDKHSIPGSPICRTTERLSWTSVTSIPKGQYNLNPM
jgi:hypothetical protein